MILLWDWGYINAKSFGQPKCDSKREFEFTSEMYNLCSMHGLNRVTFVNNYYRICMLISQKIH